MKQNRTKISLIVALVFVLACSLPSVATTPPPAPVAVVVYTATMPVQEGPTVVGQTAVSAVAASPEPAATVTFAGGNPPNLTQAVANTPTGVKLQANPTVFSFPPTPTQTPTSTLDLSWIGKIFPTATPTTKGFRIPVPSGPNIPTPTLSISPLDWKKQWFEVGGGGRTDTALAAVSYGNLLYLFGKGIDDKRIYVNTFSNFDTPWSGWYEVPGNGTTDLPLAATVFNNRIFLFGVGNTDSRIYVNQFDGGTWSGWSEVPGGGTANVAMAAAAFKDRLYLFGKGIDYKGIYVNQFDSYNWSGWSEVPGGGLTDVALGATGGPGKWLYLFGKGIDDQRVYVNKFDGSNWTGWADTSGGVATDAATAAVTLYGRPFAFIKGTDRRVYVNWLSDNWKGWLEVPGGGWTDAAPAVTFHNNLVYLFIEGTDQRIYFTHFMPGTY